MLGNVINRIRRNHALEHATVTLLLERGAASPPLGGYSTPGGFFIAGGISTDDLKSIISEALSQLNAGSSEMAVSPHCGTNLATAFLISALLTRVATAGSNGSRWKRLPLLVAAVVAGPLLSRPIGNAIQRRYTTLADMNGLEVIAVSNIWPLGKVPRLHRITTRIPK